MDAAEMAAIVPVSSLALALIITSEAPLVLMDADLRVVTASASFYRTFNIERPGSARVSFADLGHGEWNVPQLMLMLRSTAAGRPAVEGYEMDLVRPGLETCRLVVSTHKLDYDAGIGEARIVLALTDVTAARLADRQKDDLLRENQLLMKELQHRVANSLQIIASVLMQSARKVNSEESRSHLRDAHQRVMSIATLQKQLATTHDGQVGLRGYFTELCESIAASMIAGTSQLKLVPSIDDSVVDGRVSVSLELIVTELVINSLKHAFPDGEGPGTITVTFQSAKSGWSLSVEDDGAGFPVHAVDAKPGLGKGIVEALAGQLDSEVIITRLHPGTLVTVSHA